MQKQPSRDSFFPPSGWKLALIVVFLLGLGLAIRVYDLTDLPLDFHATRQLFSALKARGMYYETLPGIPEKQREFAIQQWDKKAAIEPEVLERLAAFTYRFTGEQLWVARLYSALFWVVGGIFLFLLARRLVSPDGALAALAFYLFLPYAVFASRSFQPDPLMTVLILVFWWAMDRWGERPTWKWTVLAGLFGGLAVFVKFVAAFFVVGGALGVILGRYKVREAVRNPRLWVLAGIGVLPGAVYLGYGIASGNLEQYFGGRFVPALLLDPLNYWRWMRQIEIVSGVFPLVLGLLGLFFVESKPARAFLLGLWGTYFVYGLYFDYHIASHDYYSLPLVPVTALSLAALADWVLGRLAQVTAPSRVRYLAASGLMLFGLAVNLLDIRSQLDAVDYRPQAAYWAGISRVLDGYPTVALTQDYGQRMVFWGWRSLIHWPTSGDLYYHTDIREGGRAFTKQFNSLTKDKRFFLVTDLEDLERQPLLKEWLFDHYSIFAQDEDYLIFDLEAPLK